MALAKWCRDLGCNSPEDSFQALQVKVDAITADSSSAEALLNLVSLAFQLLRPPTLETQQVYNRVKELKKDFGLVKACPGFDNFLWMW